mmetsp:Transcript_46629/g.75081  ORF Transcript_46629/g.75081 Transcript_46629/m.75081 type:complete len:105 (+) Transcript_46629:149-463(+)
MKQHCRAKNDEVHVAYRARLPKVPTNAALSKESKMQETKMKKTTIQAFPAEEDSEQDVDEESDSGSSGDGMCGFSSRDCEELMCQGVKPWDDDAGDCLDALNGY